MKKNFIVLLVIFSITFVVFGFYFSLKEKTKPVKEKKTKSSEIKDITPAFDTSISMNKIITYKAPDGFEDRNRDFDSFIHKIFIEGSNMCEFEIYYQTENYTSTLLKMKEHEISYTEKDIVVNELSWKEIESISNLEINHYYFTKYQDGFVVFHFLQIKDCKNYEEEILNSIQFQK